MYGNQQEFIDYIESEKEFDDFMRWVHHKMKEFESTFDSPSWDDYLTDEDKIFIGERVRDIVDLVIRKRSTHNE